MIVSAPVFTVVTVCYNSERFVSETIKSVLQQTYKDFEYIILDDNSSDNSWNIIKSFKDHRVKAVSNEINLGEYNNRNKAIELATGKYVIFIDGDDIIYHNALEVFLYYVKLFPDSKMFFTRGWEPRIISPFKVLPKIIYQFEYLDGGIMGKNFTKVLFDKQSIINAGYFQPGIKTGDTYMQLKIAMSNPAVVIGDGLTWWRRRKGNATYKLFKNRRHMAETLGYRLAFLNDSQCPLDMREIKKAKYNIYGIYMRTMVRMLLSFEFKDFIFLWDKIKIPVCYRKSIFIRSNYNYFNNYGGDNPLYTEPVV